MSVQRLAVHVRNTIVPLLTTEFKLKSPDEHAVLSNLCDEMLDVYHGRDIKPIIAPGGYKIPSLEQTDKELKREEPSCCGG